MSTFINDDFLLQNDFAKRLYHEYAKGLPILDYHNHLSPEAIAENKVFENLSQAWLQDDHYKWRAMRTLGVDEKFITGGASDEEKFLKWSHVVPYTVRNPLYHWTHLELQRYFNVQELLTCNNAGKIYGTTLEMLQEPCFHTAGLLKQQKVEVLCTTDDPIDSLEHHRNIGAQEVSFSVLPTFRPDMAYAVENGQDYLDYLDDLGDAANITIKTYADLISALEARIDFFHNNGGRIADHGLSNFHNGKNRSLAIDSIFIKVKEKQPLSEDEISYFKTETLLHLGRYYHTKGWVQQFHLGGLRNNNTRLLAKLGSDAGFDSIADHVQARALSDFLNNLDSTDQLPKTILYNLNPAANEVIATMTGNFNDGSIKGKVQYGPAWWFLDQKDGIEKQLNTLSNMGLLSCFVGMLSDSRSFLSFPRHEYFRRILCNLIGKDVSNGELPADEKWLGKIVADICYHNAKEYFGFQ